MSSKAVTMVLALLLAGNAVAQVDRDAYNRQREQLRQQYARQRNSTRQQYNEARRKAEEEYAAFRKKANEEYAAAMQQAWTKMAVQPAEPKPVEPKPPKPFKPAPDKMPSSVALPQGEVVLPPASIAPTPLPAIPEAETMAPTMSFQLYGTPCEVHTDNEELRFKLPRVDEMSVSAAWKQLSQEKYDGLLHDCIEQRDALHLSDWGYLRLLGKASEQLLGKGTDEAVLLQMYLLTQSGYCVRIAHTNDHLVLLVPFNRNVYNYSFIRFDGTKYYAISSTKLKGSLLVFNVGFPREQVANILMYQIPTLKGGAKLSRTLQGEKFGNMKATVEVDQSLIDYLNDYPLSDAWDYYVLTGLSDNVKATLYPALRSQLEGKSKKKGAIMLLDFVQTAFEYATDGDQFGYERPLFGDESLYYPKNDCEDRAIFYSILVRDLLGLDVVLIDWPGHVATAVAFPEEVEGDYFTVDGCRYIVCDPTYIGATIGQTMSDFEGVSAKIVKL